MLEDLIREASGGTRRLDSLPPEKLTALLKLAGCPDIGEIDGDAEQMIGRIGDGKILRWLWENRKTIVLIFKIALLFI